MPKQSEEHALEIEYLTPVEVRRSIIPAHPRTLERWAREDPSMPCLRLGGGAGKRQRLLFPRERLIAWLRAREQGRPGPRRRAATTGSGGSA